MPGLPPVRIPFPVTPVYRIRPDMVQMGQELHGEVQRDHFVYDERYPDYLEAKLDLLERCPALCHPPASLGPGQEDGLRAALWRVFELLAVEQPALVQATPAGVRLVLLGLELRRPDAEPTRLPGAPPAAQGERVERHLRAQTGLRRLADALALAVQEDLVVMRDLGDGDVAELLHVCFPSYWNPAGRVGQDFATIHRPVAHSDALVKSAPRVMRALFDKGPFVRFVWSLNTDGRLNQNPDLPGRPSVTPALDDPERLARQLHFRVERQTTHALVEQGRALFTIRIFMQPLCEAAATPSRRQVMAQALRSMDEELLAYKGLTELRAPLLSWLEQGG